MIITLILPIFPHSSPQSSAVVRGKTARPSEAVFFGRTTGALALLLVAMRRRLPLAWREFCPWLCPEFSFVTEVFPLTINIETFVFAWA